MEHEQFNPSSLEGAVPDIDELKFDIAGMESYYERNILNIGKGVLSTLNLVNDSRE